MKRIIISLSIITLAFGAWAEEEGTEANQDQTQINRTEPSVDQTQRWGSQEPMALIKIKKCIKCMSECPHKTRDLKPCDRGCPETCSDGVKDQAFQYLLHRKQRFCHIRPTGKKNKKGHKRRNNTQGNSDNADANTGAVAQGDEVATVQ
ncbi:MAG: hypothetical protein KDD33_04385 [Bdellovibrionales bacterium]|nr:hypothetical protein [Bdellovibrionales bacterium]